MSRSHDFTTRGIAALEGAACLQPMKILDPSGIPITDPAGRRVVPRKNRLRSDVSISNRLHKLRPGQAIRLSDLYRYSARTRWRVIDLVKEMSGFSIESRKSRCGPPSTWIVRKGVAA